MKELLIDELYIMSRSKKQLHNLIRRRCGKAIADFQLIEEGDRIAVALSGGKDSWTLLHILDDLRRRAPVHFELIALNIDPGFAGYRTDLLREYLEKNTIAYHFEKTEAAAIIEEKRRSGSSYCSFCARLRRGFLYTQAQRLQCNKVALGHHLDDFIETLLLNQFYSGCLGAMGVKLLADNNRQTVIRPLVYVEEAQITAYSKLCDFPVISCACPLEITQGKEQRRQQMKRLIEELAQEIPDLRSSLLRSLSNVHHRHLLAART